MSLHELNAKKRYPGSLPVCWLPTPNAKVAFGVLDDDGDPLGYGCDEKELLRHWPQ